MPTKKRRVGFIPRSEVLALINKLSYESNLSYSKVINILVEEALYKRGIFDKESKLASNKILNSSDNTNKEKLEFINKEFKNNYQNNLLNHHNLNFKEVKEEPFDNEMYSKFLMFLQFQERMKKGIS